MITYVSDLPEPIAPCATLQRSPIQPASKKGCLSVRGYGNFCLPVADCVGLIGIDWGTDPTEINPTGLAAAFAFPLRQLARIGGMAIFKLPRSTRKLRSVQRAWSDMKVWLLPSWSAAVTPIHHLLPNNPVRARGLEVRYPCLMVPPVGSRSQAWCRVPDSYHGFPTGSSAPVHGTDRPVRSVYLFTIDVRYSGQTNAGRSNSVDGISRWDLAWRPATEYGVEAVERIGTLSPPC
ncbi:hypothetical protein BO94DRAFT_325914 [Aspergillus sclerotioniger CBS 115572]|uniref:Uncharacterized protein n=1 Tax=Aspergillus sclerotioniger CBS 115572 TaxID=1450535 RepID=A0A317X6J7_9EURO|nr:hypothetical protein BO94DRAFT_325914 [Aspergillus sclerotioniger CBS 115572]PWY94246.1 hypothetical protein BO94DRAFT_325914 [Aspergillus sclerotioniger CBS 115572]